MWDFQEINTAFDEYVQQIKSILFGDGSAFSDNSSECIEFFQTCKRLFISSLEAVQLAHVRGIVIGGFYVNDPEQIPYYSGLTISTGMDVMRNSEDSEDAKLMVEELIGLYKQGDVLWLRTPFIIDVRNRDKIGLCIAAFSIVLDTIFNNILSVHRGKFTNPIPVLTLGINSYSEVIESLSVVARRPIFVLLPSVHPKFVVECDKRSTSGGDDDYIRQMKYRALDYFIQIVNIFKVIKKNAEFQVVGGVASTTNV